MITWKRLAKLTRRGAKLRDYRWKPKELRKPDAGRVERRWTLPIVSVVLDVHVAAQSIPLAL
jgi:hypothetical protein